MFKNDEIARAKRISAWLQKIARSFESERTPFENAPNTPSDAQRASSPTTHSLRG
ncbi:MAG: hypothetical protein IPK60_18010 [Sandaracinaceae bacterium]|jgi:hypothetical protein|nr:hypothetical protein [Sandaracinaceae bacterium]